MATHPGPQLVGQPFQPWAARRAPTLPAVTHGRSYTWPQPNRVEPRPRVAASRSRSRSPSRRDAPWWNARPSSSTTCVPRTKASRRCSTHAARPCGSSVGAAELSPIRLACAARQAAAVFGRHGSTTRQSRARAPSASTATIAMSMSTSRRMTVDISGRSCAGHICTASATRAGDAIVNRLAATAWVAST